MNFGLFLLFADEINFCLCCSADFGIIGLGKSDPYCKITVSSFNLQTQVIPNTINPQFNFICEVAIGDLDDQEIDIEVFDKDQNTADDFLGRLTLRLAEYDCTGEKSHWIPLEVSVKFKCL